jgi:hypothetical protein
MSSQLGFLTLSCALRLFNIHQKISVLRSNTWLTEDSAFLLIPKQRYCLVANRNGVSSEEEDDGTTTVGSANTSEWDCRMAKTRCNESNLDLISCDRGSFSLSSLERGVASRSVYLFIFCFLAFSRNVPFTQQRLHS